MYFPAQHGTKTDKVLTEE